MCIFCQIAAGTIPCYKVYEDDDILAFLDIHPVSPGHTLVLPKKHFQNLEEIDDASLAALLAAVKKIGLKLKERFGAEGYNVCENNDPVAGQVIPHIHFHLIPRKPGDGLENWPGREYAPGEAEGILTKILD